MAFYNYTCVECGEFALWRKLDERNLPAACPECQAAAVRSVSAPNLSLMSSGRRQAHARNEKSRHEPGVTTGHRCGTGCRCGSASDPARKATRTVDLGKAGRFEASKKTKRPWMLGH